MGLEVEVVAETHKFDVVIVGASMAGMLASISLKNQNIKCAFLEKSIPGGSLRNVLNIENFMGIASINGGALCDQIFNHATLDKKIPYFYANIHSIKQQQNSKFYLYSNEGKVWEAKIVIFACKLIDNSIISHLNNLCLSNQKIEVNENFETPLKNFYAIGSCVGCDGLQQQLQSANIATKNICKLLKTNE